MAANFFFLSQWDFWHVSVWLLHDKKMKSVSLASDTRRHRQLNTVCSIPSIQGYGTCQEAVSRQQHLHKFSAPQSWINWMPTDKLWIVAKIVRKEWHPSPSHLFHTQCDIANMSVYKSWERFLELFLKTPTKNTGPESRRTSLLVCCTTHFRTHNLKGEWFNTKIKAFNDLLYFSGPIPILDFLIT